VAAIRITPLHHGSLKADRDLLISGHPDLILTRTHQKRPRVLCEVPIISYVIDHPEGRLLFDAAMPANWRTWWPAAYQEAAFYDDADPNDYFEPLLKRAGYAPDDFRYVILSHLHCDHAGNAKLFARTNNVQLLVHEKELRGALALEEDHEFYLRGDYDVPGLKLSGVYGDREILRGVHLMEVPGHTWGTMALVIETGRENVILTSDSCYLADGYGPPGIPSIITMDKMGWAASLEKIRRRATRMNARVIFGHDHECVVHHAQGTRRERLSFWPDGHY